MFNLEEAVSGWRDSLKDADALSALDVTELEGHLREEAARVEALGLSAEEAFVIASRRMGSPNALNAEYEKADPAQAWRTRTFWIVLGMFGYWAWTSFTSMLTSAAYPLTWAGYVPAWIAAPVFLAVWSLMMAFIIRVIFLMSQGKLTRMTSAMQKRYRRKYRLLTDVLVLVVVLPIARDGWQGLVGMLLSRAGAVNHPSDFYLMSYAGVATTFGGPMAIGILLYLLQGSRRVSTE